ncbi:MAG: OstA-like protein [Bacteroidota bacterium]
MSRQTRTIALFAAACVSAVCVPVAAQEQGQRIIVLQHADSLVGRVIDGEDARELIGGVIITHERVRISCDRALQFIRRGRVELTGNVVVQDDSMTLRAPRGTYFREERKAGAFDDVFLTDGTVEVRALYGQYLIDPRRAFFHTRVVVVDSLSVMTAESLSYDRNTRRSVATGNVRVTNEAERVTITGGRLDHDAMTQYSRMTIRPMLVQIDTAGGGRADTLQIRGTVLEAIRDSTRRLIARDSVMMVRSELAARAQYACMYMRGDSITLRKQPVIWYENTQVYGDSINIYLRHRRVRRVLVMGNAFAGSRSDTGSTDRVERLAARRFDQLTGDRMTMQFDSAGLRLTDVEGRAISLYYLYDDSLANGLNKTSGDRIVMLFSGGRASTITVYGGVEGQYYPENMVARREHEYTIPGFRWLEDRPMPIRPAPAGARRGP